MNSEYQPLPARELFHACDPDSLPFDDTSTISPHDWVVGQDRALDALSMGIGIGGDGYNVFALGTPGTGRFSVVQRVLQREAVTRPVPDDWCYINNFEHPHKPCALRLPPGRGVHLHEDMNQFIDDLLTTIPSAFESEQYQSSVEKLESELESRRDGALNELAEQARDRHVQLLHTPAGFAFAPIDEEGEVIRPEAFKALEETERKEVEATVEDLQKQLQRVIRQFPLWQKEAREKRRDLEREIARYTVGHLIEVLKEQYQDLSTVLDYLDAVDADVIEHVKELIGQQQAAEHPEAAAQMDVFLQRYRVNVLVDNGQGEGAPVVHQDLPSHANLNGRAEYRAHMGNLVTDFTLIKSGDLHRANGGYLVLDARRLLMQPFAWHSLQRALRSREVRVEPLERIYGLLSTVSLEPEAIPLDVKVVIIGERQFYYLLYQYDPEFRKQFKVCADFEETVPRDGDEMREYTRLLAGIIDRHQLMAFDAPAVARVIEHSTRLSGDREKLSIHQRSIAELMREANYWAGESGNRLVTRADVRRAIETRVYHSDRIRGRIYEAIEQGTIRIQATGSQVGQVNGLSVLDLGNFAFGQPSRITATTRIGDGKVIDIERETRLGGRLHSKGVMILANYLASTYARHIPLSMSASLVFEQSYGMVDGDSASLAELCALLSALSGCAIEQRFAMTGSVNQLGQVQAIGGVNEKVEGFFDVCQALGFSGEQGVLIPASNVRHLMLREDVVAAAEDGRFRIFAVDDVNTAIAILTGVEAGSRDEETQQFPEHSINGRVESSLLKMATLRRDFGKNDGPAKEEATEADDSKDAEDNGDVQ